VTNTNVGAVISKKLTHMFYIEPQRQCTSECIVQPMAVQIPRQHVEQSVRCGSR